MSFTWLNKKGEAPLAKKPEDKLKFYSQAYEPTHPHAVETGAMAEVDLHCFLTMPSNGLKVFTITYKDGTSKKVALLPMLGPWGSETKYGCYGDGAAQPNAIRKAYTLPGTAWQEDGFIGSPGVNGFLGSYHPEDAFGGSYAEWNTAEIKGFHDFAISRGDNNGNYINGHSRLYNVFKSHSPEGLRCLVVGSAPNPWVEGILLAFGAAHVTTSEYQVPSLPHYHIWTCKP